MQFPDDLSYTSEHEWLRLDGDEGAVGLTDYAQDRLGDVVYVELPEVGAGVQRGAPFGVIESVKAVSDLYAPVSGEVIARNDALTDAPELVNRSPYDEAWLIRVRLTDRSEVDALLDAAEYEAQLPADDED